MSLSVLAHPELHGMGKIIGVSISNHASKKKRLQPIQRDTLVYILTFTWVAFKNLEGLSKR